MSRFKKIIKSRDFPALVAFILAVIYFVVSVFHNYSPDNIPFTNDIALSNAIVRLMSEGQNVLLGPPSHTGGRHLGPLYYWYLWLASALSGGDPYLTAMVCTVFKIIGVFICCWMLSSYSLWHAAGALLCFSTLPYIEVLRTPWHPHELLFFVSLYLYATQRLLEKGGQNFPLYLLAAFMAVQLHYSAILLVAPVSIAVIGWLLYTQGAGFFRSILPKKLYQYIFYAAAILLWLPPVIYEMYYASNIRALVNGQALARQQHDNFKTVIDIFSAFFKDFTFGAHILPATFKSSASLLLKLAAVIFAGVLVFFLRREKLAKRVFFGALLCACCAYFFALLPLRNHAVYFLYGLLPLPAIFFGYLFGTLIKSNNYCAKALLIVLLFLPIRQITLHFRGLAPKTSVLNSLTHAEEMADSIKADYRQNPPARIMAGAASVYSKDAFLFFLGKDYFPQMQYWNLFNELSTEGQAAASDTAYLVACPQIYSADLKAFMEEHDVERERNVSLANCKTCGKCILLNLQLRRP
jgi:hypothetical protein